MLELMQCKEVIMVAVRTVLDPPLYALLRGVSVEQHERDVERSIAQTGLLREKLNELFDDRKFTRNHISNPYSSIEIAQGEIAVQGFEGLIVIASYYPLTNEVFVNVRRKIDSLKPHTDFDNLQIYLIDDNGERVGVGGNFNYLPNSLGLHARVPYLNNATGLIAVANI